jgi:hypothetical protein
VATVTRLQAITGRPVAIDALKIDLLTGRIALRGLRITDVDGAPLANLQRLDAQIRLRSLLRGHISLTRLVIDGSTVRVVRWSQGDFNISDLLPKKSGGGSTFDVTVSDFGLTRGTVVLEDRMLTPARTWRSEHLTIQARNVSTRRDDGTGEATSTINGSPVSVRVDQLRLKPVHVRAAIEAKNVDAAMARVYLPPNAPVTLERGRLDLTMSVLNDARDGVRVDADVAVSDAVAIRPAQRDPFIQAPALRVAVRAFTVSPEGAMAVQRVELEGGGRVLHGNVTTARTLRFRSRAPERRGPHLARAGAGAREPRLHRAGGRRAPRRRHGTGQTRVANLDVRLSGLAIEPWARYVSSSAKASGIGEARLAVRASFEDGVSASATGTVAVNRVLVTDGERRLLAADRAEVSGIDAGWPLRVALGRVTLRRPAVSLERDAAGLVALPTRDNKAPSGDHANGGARTSETPPPPITIREVVVDDGALDWRDAAVKPAARLEMRAINLAVQDVGWPLERPAAIRLRLRTPGGGSLVVSGNATLETADARIRAQGVELAPYGPYLPISAALRGNVDADVQARVSRASGLEAQVRGDAGLNRAFLADGARRIASIDRARARGIDVSWPGRVAVDDVTLRQPWVLVERDERSTFPLRTLLSPAGGATTSGGATTDAEATASSATGAERTRAITIRRLVVEDGGVRFVDHSIAPPYSEDLKQAWLQITGLASAPAPPARLEMRGSSAPRDVSTCAARSARSVARRWSTRPPTCATWPSRA